jgi:hypothetical protein
MSGPEDPQESARATPPYEPQCFWNSMEMTTPFAIRTTAGNLLGPKLYRHSSDSLVPAWYGVPLTPTAASGALQLGIEGQ